MYFEFVSEQEKKKFSQLGTPLLQLPSRSSACAAGYDFVLPFDVELPVGGQVIVPTMVRVRLENNRALFIYPRSSFGIKKGIVLANTVGIIDADYYGNSDNGGHIFIALKNTSNESYRLSAGTRFAQGIIQEFFLVDGDDFNKGRLRQGGIGSTGEAAGERHGMENQDPEAVSVCDSDAATQVRNIANIFRKPVDISVAMHKVMHSNGVSEVVVANESVDGHDISLRLRYKGYAYGLSLLYDFEPKLVTRFGKLGMSQSDYDAFVSLLKKYGV